MELEPQFEDGIVVWDDFDFLVDFRGFGSEFYIKVLYSQGVSQESCGWGLPGFSSVFEVRRPVSVFLNRLVSVHLL